MKPQRNTRPLAFAFALAATNVAHAVTFTVDDPNPVLIRPTTGTLTYNFTGTVAYSATEFPAGYGNSAADTAAGDSLFPLANDAGLAPLRNPGDAFTGTLFSITIDPSTPLGVYDQFAPNSPPVFDIGYRDGSLTAPNQDIRLPYSITVQAVPEPASCAALGLGALSLIRRRRR